MAKHSGTPGQDWSRWLSDPAALGAAAVDYGVDAWQRGRFADPRSARLHTGFYRPGTTSQQRRDGDNRNSLPHRRALAKADQRVSTK